MKITNKIVRGRIFEAYIQTDFNPAEIIAVREDGACESTRAVNSLNYTRRLLAMETEANQKLSAEIERLKSLNAAALEAADANVASLLQMRAERDGAHKYAERLKSDLFESMYEVEAIKVELANLHKSAKFRVIDSLRAEAARMPHVHLNEVCQLKAERDELKGKVGKLSAELDKAKSIFNMSAQTVYGMSLDEIRKIKAERDALQAECQLKNKWIEGARELEAIRVQLAEQGIKI